MRASRILGGGALLLTVAMLSSGCCRTVYGDGGGHWTTVKNTRCQPVPVEVVNIGDCHQKPKDCPDKTPEVTTTPPSRPHGGVPGDTWACCKLPPIVAPPVDGLPDVTLPTVKVVQNVYQTVEVHRVYQPTVNVIDSNAPCKVNHQGAPCDCFRLTHPSP